LDDWILAGDFNLIRSTDNWNRDRATSVTCYFLMILFNIWIWQRLVFKVEVTLRVICSRIHS
jgi:hypothetical protein